MESEKFNLEDLAFSGRLRNAPRSEIRIEVAQDRMILDGSASWPAEEEGTPVEVFLWAARDSNPAPLTILAPEERSGQPLDGQVETPRLELAIPQQDGEYYFILEVRDRNDRRDTSTSYFVVENGQARLDDWDTENTDWVETAVVYGVIPRNFDPPGFQGVINWLDDLRDLGVTALWLSPVNSTPEGNFGYHVLNYFELAERNGSKEDFRRLVDEAHRRGIRVLMDFVPNHTSDQHRYFQDTLEKGRDSRYWDFYDRDETGAHTHYFHWTYLPNLNFNNPEVTRWITEAFAYWVREFDVDGFRVDVAWGIRQRNPEYWPYWRRELKRIKPDLLLLAEAGARDSYYFTNGFDAAYDWTDELGHGAWEHVFEDPAKVTERLTPALTNEGRGFHEDALVFHFLNNNDTAERFITRYGPEMNRVATALLLTLPGIPCVYTGDEVGAEFLPYKNPTPITWEERQPGLRDYHKKLITLRKTVPALHSRRWQILEVEPKEKAYAYLRTAGENDPPVLVLLNFAGEPVEAGVRLPEEYRRLTEGSELRDLLSGQAIPIRGNEPLRVEAPSFSALLLDLGATNG